MRSRRSFLGLLLVLAAIMFETAQAEPNINVATRHDVTDQDFPNGGWIDWHFNQSDGGFVYNRMGMATLNGVSYYAIRDQSACIRVVPAGGQDEPTRGNVCIANYGVGVIKVGDLFASDGGLWLISYVQQKDTGQKFGIIFAQKFAPDPANPVKLRAVTGVIRQQVESLDKVIAVQGDDGIYVHAFLKGSGQRKLVSFRLKGGDLVLGSQMDLSEADYPAQDTTCDGIATHYLDSLGAIQSAQLLVWGNNSGHFVFTKFEPSHGSYASHIATSRDMTYQQADGALFSLVEGNMDGNDQSSSEYCVSLVKFARDFDPPLNQFKVIIDQHAISVKNFGSPHDCTVGEWNRIPQDTPAHTNIYAAIHAGIDKGMVRAAPSTVKGVKGVNNDATFADQMQQWFRMGTIQFSGEVTESSRLFMFYNVIEARGYRFVTDDSLKPAGITRLQTDLDFGTTEKRSLLSAWTLVGVVHGVPPFVEHKAGDPFPTVSFEQFTSQTNTTDISFTTENSYEWSVGVTNTATAEFGGFLSVDSSYSHGFKTATTKSSTSSTTISTSGKITFDPGLATDYDPRRVGLLLYAAPTLVSKAYKIAHVDGGGFQGEKRSISLTTVAGMTLHPFTYLMDQPELGPLEGMPVGHGENPLVDLTKGLPPVPAPIDFQRWGKVQVDGSIGTFDETDTDFRYLAVNNIQASKTRFQEFTLSYVQTSGSGQSRSETTTDKENVKVSVGLADIFGFTGSGKFSQSQTYAFSQSSSTQIGASIRANYSRIPDDSDVQSITVDPLLIFAGKKNPSWVPDLVRGTRIPFLLTWHVTHVEPPQAMRKPWKFR